MTNDDLREAMELAGFYTSIHNHPVVAISVADAMSIIAPVLAEKDDDIELLQCRIATLIRERDNVREIIESYRP